MPATWAFGRLVAETPGAGHDYRQAQAHADAMAAHRQHVVATIQELEQRQDQLLDAMGASVTVRSSVSTCLNVSGPNAKGHHS